MSIDQYSVTSDTLVRIDNRWHLFKGSWTSIKNIVAYRDLLVRLTVRDVRARYKDSSLGLVWSLIRPLTLILIYFVAIGHFLGAARAIPDFVIFMFSGFAVWGLFSETVSAGTSSIIANSGLVKKVALPREIFPLSATGGATFNFLIQLALLLGVIVLTGALPEPRNILYPILGISLILVFGTALSLIFSAINVYLRDVQHVVEVILLVLFWCSPIVYSPALVVNALSGNFLETLYFLNPVTIAVVSMQKGLWAAGVADPAQYWPPNLLENLGWEILVSIALLWFSQRIFSKLEGNFAQEL